MRLDLMNVRAIAPAELSRSLISELRVGAILQAVVTRTPNGSGSDLWLAMGNQRYAARLASGGTHSGAVPADGEKLTVRVLRNSPVLALETLESESTAGADEAVTADALRRHVPRQTSPAPLLSNIAWLARGDAAGDALPEAVTQAAGRLWQALPDMDTLTDPKGLQNAIARSGTFLEAELARSNDARATGAAVATDLKALLLGLTKTLRDLGARPASTMNDTVAPAPMPGARGALTSMPAAPATLAVLDAPAQQLNELAKQAEGALSRLTTVQLTNTPQDNAAVQSMLIELPVRHEDRASMLRLRIDHDRSRRQEYTGDSWTVEAAMDLGAIGALHARVTLQGQRIGVQLRAESAGVVEALAARSGELESMLREAGLEVDRVVCLHGMPAGEAGSRLTRLLDIRA